MKNVLSANKIMNMNRCECEILSEGENLNTTSRRRVTFFSTKIIRNKNFENRFFPTRTRLGKLFIQTDIEITAVVLIFIRFELQIEYDYSNRRVPLQYCRFFSYNSIYKIFIKNFNVFTIQIKTYSKSNRFDESIINLIKYYSSLINI